MTSTEDLIGQLRTMATSLTQRRQRPRNEWFAQLGAFGDDFFSDE